LGDAAEEIPSREIVIWLTAGWLLKRIRLGEICENVHRNKVKGHGFQPCRKVVIKKRALALADRG